MKSGISERAVRARRWAFGAPVPGAVAALADIPEAAAQERFTEAAMAVLDGDPVLVAQIAIFLAMGVMIVFVASRYVRARKFAETALAKRHEDVSALRARVDEVEILLNSDDQRLVAWGDDGAAPQCFGMLPKSAQAPVDRQAFLAFGSWLRANDTQHLERAIEELRLQGTAFLETVETLEGTFLEVAGRTSGGRALVRFRDLTAERSDTAALTGRYEDLRTRFDALRAVLDACSAPIWQKSSDDRLIWVNPAYRKAVDAPPDAAVYDLPAHLLETNERAKLAAARDDAGVARATLPVVVAGDRRTFDVVEVAAPAGVCGVAIDITDIERTQTALRRTEDFHASTLDQLATAVAIFGADQRLRSHNAAYQDLWSLDPAFLQSHPDDGAILDRLRSERRLPEQADYRGWKAEMLEVYRQVDPREHWWHLPDGKTVRVLANPHPQGGVTYIYENVTEQLNLESRYNSLIRVQGETLDHLSEAVAVFGPDGKMRLWNPAFSGMWQVDQTILDSQPHVSDVVARCSRLFDNPHLWSDFTSAVTGLAETRESASARIERPDDAVIDVATVPLPDGSTLATFVDISDTVKVERALTEKNAALQAADELKNAFIQNVSYELRSPLTNIIGFAQLLADTSIGQLNEKQTEYTGYIQSSSAALLTIINDILDLATIDAGIMELNLGEVDIQETIDAAIEALQDRLAEADIGVVVDVAPGVGTMIADERRLRQILYNLIANAVSYSEDGSSISVHCSRTGAFIELAVQDNGCGIPADIVASVFDRFEGRSSGGRRRGAGLGLSIVKSFVELHNGVIDVESSEAAGTKVVCRFPVQNAPTVH